MCEYNSTFKWVNHGHPLSHDARFETPLSNLRGWNEKVKMERLGKPEKSNRGTGDKAGLQQVIMLTTGYSYHSPNKTDILIPTGTSAICGCKECQITASHCTAGCQGSHVSNWQVMNLRARPLSYIKENGNSHIKSSFGNGLFLLFLSSFTYGESPFITICIQVYLILITTLQVLNWGCVLEYYIFIVQSSFLFIILLITVTDFTIFGIWTQLHSSQFALMS